MAGGLITAIREIRVMHMGQRGAKAMRAGRYEEAERLFRHCLDIMRRISGQSFQTSVYTWNLGEALMLQDRQDDAVPLFEETLVICRQVIEDRIDLPMSDPNFEAVVAHYMRCLLKLRRLTEIYPTIRYYLDARYEQFGIEDMQTAASLAGTADSHFSRGDAEGATAVYYGLHRTLSARGQTDPEFLDQLQTEMKRSFEQSGSHQPDLSSEGHTLH